MQIIRGSIQVPRVLIVTVVLAIVTAKPGLAQPRGYISYKPPIVPVEITLDTSGNVQVYSSSSWVTPLGTFTLGLTYDDEDYSVLTLLIDGREYKYAIGGQGFDVHLSGLRLLRLTEDGKGNVTVVAAQDRTLLNSRSPSSSVPPSNHDPRKCSRCIQDAQAAGLAAVKKIGGHDPNKCQKCREIYINSYNAFMDRASIASNVDPKRSDTQASRDSVVMSLTLTDECNDSLGNRVRFYDKNKNLVWPNAEQDYVMSRGETRTFKLDVARGSSICYGARPDRQGAAIYWGIGIDGDKGCTNCCYYGNSAAVSIRLVCS